VILHRDYGVPREAFSPDATLVTLGLDSLSVLELMFKIEDGFGVKIDEDLPRDLHTVSDVVNFIDGLLARAPGGNAGRPVEVAGIP
jgi:acyl carrier protein